MRARGRLTAGIVLVSMLAVTTAVPVAANVRVISDRNDTRGPLDLDRVRISHARRNADRIELRTIEPFTDAQIDGKIGWLAVLFSGRGRSVDWTVYLYHDNGRYHGIGVSPSGSYAGRFSVKRLDGRTLVMFYRFIESDRMTYSIVGGSAWKGSPCSRPCVDLAPNDRWLLHDVIAPTAKCCKLTAASAANLPLYEPVSSTALSFPISFSVMDDRYGSGVRSWRFQGRLWHTDHWKTLKTGHAPRPSIRVSGEQGAWYEYRVVVADRHGNRGISDSRVGYVPIDDTSSMFDYGGTWTPVSNAFDLLGGHRAGDNGSTVTTTIRGARLCVFHTPTDPGETASATYIVKDLAGISPSFGGTLTMVDSSKKVCDSLGPSEDRNRNWLIEITVTSDTPFPFDGIVALPPV